MKKCTTVFSLSLSLLAVFSACGGGGGGGNDFVGDVNWYEGNYAAELSLKDSTCSDPSIFTFHYDTTMEVYHRGRRVETHLHANLNSSGGVTETGFFSTGESRDLKTGCRHQITITAEKKNQADPRHLNLYYSVTTLSCSNPAQTRCVSNYQGKANLYDDSAPM